MSSVEKNLRRIVSAVKHIAKKGTRTNFQDVRKKDMRNPSFSSARKRFELDDFQGSALVVRTLIEQSANDHISARYLKGKEMIFEMFKDKSEAARHDAYHHWIQLNRVIHNNKSDVDSKMAVHHCIEYFERLLQMD